MAGAVVHLITDRGTAPDLVGAVASALSGGVHWVQLRDKSPAARDLLELARRIQPLCQDHRAGLLINDRLDVALAAGCHGVHLAKKSLPVKEARRLVPANLLVGVSVHSVEEAVAAAADGADYVTFGSVFPTRSHPGRPAAGVDLLAQVVHAVNIPVLAIGGITPDNVDAVLATGVAGVAVISSILAEADPARAAARLRETMERSQHRPRFPFPPVGPFPDAHRCAGPPPPGR
ncbi:thiamine-phosphate diphosphorylase [Thermaerobacter marianensis DSM 12885]|uniref:Thiamine-phosphate synthase n=1 Tax=Thermaerobacter marianensis (strain ATCC 700841 / DSM 12885 / JCM 10246 / 7p75a) TaxID=644966 RepID=E6SIE4_THEM7|nr:thiamine phosphate synthase [Thermaerobacter marianensis]ADU51955.1 thiamine-phosphate diphosphorylase [Thermaerobacter marianensis DSM 12885]